MFDIGWSELLVIAVVAIVVVGPKDLPALLRVAGQWMAKVRRMAAEFQSQVNEAMREAELDEARKALDELRAANPVNTVRDAMEDAARPLQSLQTEFEQPPTVAPMGTPPVGPTVTAPGQAEGPVAGVDPVPPPPDYAGVPTPVTSPVEPPRPENDDVRRVAGERRG